MAWVGHGHVVLTKRLVPAKLALVTIEQIAELTACKLFLCYLGLMYIVACQNLSDSIEIVAIVDGDCAALVCQREAVACACTFGEFTSRVAIIQSCTAISIRPTREGAVHRAALETHFAERSTVVKGDICIVGTNHASIASHLIHGTRDVDIRNNVLHKDCAITPSDECAVVNLCHVYAAFYTKIANSSIFHESKEATPLFCYLIIIIVNGVVATVEDTCERPVFRA